MRRTYAILTACLVCLTASMAFADGPGGVTVRQSTPEELIETSFAAVTAGDLQALVQTNHPDHQKAMKAFVDSIPALIEKAKAFKAAWIELADAAGKAYGAELGDKLKNGIDKMPVPDIGQAAASAAGEVKDVYIGGKVDWTKVKITLDGDKGQVTWPGLKSSPVLIAKVDQKWYFVPDNKGDGKAAEFNAMLEAFAKAITKIGEMTAQVKAGQLTNVQFAQQLIDFGKWMETAMPKRNTSPPQPADNTPPAVSPSDRGHRTRDPDRRAGRDMPPLPGSYGPPPMKNVADALGVLAGTDIFHQAEALKWLVATSQIDDSDRPKVLAAAKSLMPVNQAIVRGPATDLFCKLAGKDQVGDLVTLLGMDKKDALHAPVLRALMRINPAKARGVLEERSDDFFFTSEAKRSLTAMGPSGEDGVIVLLGSSKAKIRDMACDVLADIGTTKSIAAIGQTAKLLTGPEQAAFNRKATGAMNKIKFRTGS